MGGVEKYLSNRLEMDTELNERWHSGLIKELTGSEIIIELESEKPKVYKLK